MPITHHFSNSHGFNAASTITMPLRIWDVPDRFLVVMVALMNTVTVSSMEWRPSASDSPPNDQALTLLYTQIHPTLTTLRYEVWALINPTPHTGGIAGGSVFAQLTGTSRAAYTAAVYGGVHQTTPYDGWPSTPTALQTTSGSAIPGTTTNVLTVSSAVGERVLDFFQSNMESTASSWAAPNVGQNIIGTGRSFGGSTANSPRMAVGIKDGAASVTSQWLMSATGRSYVASAFPIKPSSLGGPRYVLPKQTVLAIAGDLTLPQATLNVQSTTDFPAVGSLFIGAPYTWDNGRLVEYTGITATSFTGCTGGSAAVRSGDAVHRVLATGNESGSSIDIRIPSDALVDDIVVVSIYSQDTATLPANANFTAIGSPAVQTGFRHDLFYRRLTAGNPGSTFNFTTGTAIRSATWAVFRECVTSGSPIASGLGAPVNNTGSGLTATTAASETTEANQLAVLSYCQLNGTGWVVTIGHDHEERTKFAQMLVTDMPVPASGTSIGFNSADGTVVNQWTARTFLLRATVSQFLRSNSYTQSMTNALSRAGSTWHKSSTYIQAMTNIVGRIGSTLHRSIAYTRSMVNSVNRDLIARRTNSYVRATFTIVSRRGSTYRRTMGFSKSLAHTVSRVINAGPATIFRTLQYTRAMVNSVSRRGSIYHKSRTSSIAMTNTVSRRGTVVHRSITHTRSMVNVVSRRGSIFHRSRTETRSFVMTVSRNIVGASISFFAFGTKPVLRLYTAARFTSATFYFEAVLDSSSVSSPAYARLWDVTAGVAAPGSQIQTSVPHTTSQRVRSGPVTLVDGNVYRAEVGKASGFTSTMVSADIIVETP